MPRRKETEIQKKVMKPKQQEEEKTDASRDVLR